MAQLRLGFVGAGFMGQAAHLRNYSLLALEGKCTLAALAEPREDLARDVAARFAIPRVYSDHKELLEQGEVDAIVAIQPFQRYAEMLPDLLQAGIPVLTEKPMCLSLETARDLVELGERHGVVHMIGYNKRSDPAVMAAGRLAQDWKASGEYGALRHIRVTVAYPGDWRAGDLLPVLTSKYPTPTGSLEPYPAEFGPVVGERFRWFLDAHSHHVNLPRAFLGEPYQVAYASPSGTLLVGESPSGVTVSIEVSPYATASWDESVTVGFEGASINLGLRAPLAQVPGTLRVYREFNRRARDMTAVHEEPLLPYRSSMLQQAMNFLRAAQNIEQPPVDAREALEDMELVYTYFRLPLPDGVEDLRGDFAAAAVSGRSIASR